MIGIVYPLVELHRERSATNAASLYLKKGKRTIVFVDNFFNNHPHTNPNFLPIPIERLGDLDTAQGIQSTSKTDTLNNRIMDIVECRM